MNKSYYQIEYHIGSCKYHYNDLDSPESDGWKIVAKDISFENCLEFCNMMNVKYDDVDNPLTLEEVQEKFIEFLTTPAKLV